MVKSLQRYSEQNQVICVVFKYFELAAFALKHGIHGPAFYWYKDTAVFMGDNRVNCEIDSAIIVVMLKLRELPP